MSDNREQWLAGLIRGEIRSFNFFFEEFYAPLLYYTRNIVHDVEEAKDIVLNTFHKLWEKKDRFENYQNVKSFLYLVAKNASLDYLKQKQRNLARFKEFSLSASLLDNENDYLAMEAEILKKIDQEVARLPEKCRRVFELSFLEGKSIAEIAELLQISPGNVSSQRHRALELLRLALKDSPLAVLYLLARFMH